MNLVLQTAKRNRTSDGTDGSRRRGEAAPESTPDQKVGLSEVPDAARTTHRPRAGDLLGSLVGSAGAEHLGDGSRLDPVRRPVKPRLLEQRNGDPDAAAVQHLGGRGAR